MKLSCPYPIGKYNIFFRHALLFWGLIIAVMTLHGCSGTTLKPIRTDRMTGYFMNKAESKKATILIGKKIPLKSYKKLIYIRPNSQNFMNDQSEKIDAFVKEMIESLHFFDQVADQTEFGRILAKTGIAYKVTNISDLIGLYQVQKLFGNYLTAEFDFALTAPHLDGTNCVANLKIIDPSTMNVVLHVQNRAFVVSGFDQPLFYPVFNSLIDWIQKNSI